MIPPKVLMIGGEADHFCAHLLPIALKAQEKGYEVHLLLKEGEYNQTLRQSGFILYPILMNRKSLNPLVEKRLMTQYGRIIQKVQPHVLHLFMIKPIVYGTILGRLMKVPRIINTYLGMGTLFIGESLSLRLVRSLVVSVMGLFSKSPHVFHVTQNVDDQREIIRLGIAPQEQTRVQCSVGVDCGYFGRLPLPSARKIVFALVGRMLRDKGVREFVAAAKILKQQGYEAEFWLVGDPDSENRTSISLATLQEWAREGNIIFKGHQDDVRSIWAKAHVAVLPSYREGLSRSLLEAGACGRAVITTDAPGGNDLITPGINGLLVPPKNPMALADAMRTLLDNPEKMVKFAEAFHKTVLENYTSEYCAEKMVELYENK